MKTLFRNLAGVFILLFSVTCLASAQVPVYNVKNYGAQGDGKNIDTKAIETADAAGGTVYFPAGNYLSVTIHLKSNVALYIDPGATTIAATTGQGVQYDLPEKSDNDLYQDYGHSHFHNSLLVGENLHDISITGPGAYGAKAW